MEAPAIDVIRLPGHLTYTDAYARQMQIVEELAAAPARRARLLILEHTPVYTLGRTTKPEHLPLPPDELARASGAEVVRIDRGGSVTYHGPGQLTAYLILHLKAWDLSIHQHLWNLEEIAIRAGAAFGVEGFRQEGMTGAWALDENGTLAKYCAIGVGSRRWVTYHGLGLNVDLDLTPFQRIDPCGLGRPVSDLSRLTGRRVTLDEAAQALATATAAVLKHEMSIGPQMNADEH
jgi:lipoate-protein ligase B